MMTEELAKERRKFNVICPLRNDVCGKTACALWDYEYGECAFLEIARFTRKIAENLKKRGGSDII
jgi:hypothetical protein